ncbi:MAG TPA: hypothetical protein VEU62_06205 [Bryobacterales bacterium]|nr:hypothetical protein [Bryobacterales bacterium]
MFIRNSVAGICLAAGTALAQLAQPLNPASAIRFNLAPGAPVSVVSTDLGDSRIQPRGGAMILDLHATLVLRNNGSQNVRGVTLVVLAQEMTPGGKGSVAVPSLNVPPGQSFPLKINLRLLRPLPAPAGPLVKVDLDGVLFADLSFFGPNQLESRRTMTAWEMEARRDREYLKSVLAEKGAAGLQQEVFASLSRQQARPRLDVQVSRREPRAISAAVNALTTHSVSFALLKIPDSPLELLSGEARVSGDEAASPRIEVVNRSKLPVRYFEMGWIVKDSAGDQFLAGSIPASSALDAGRSATATQDRTYKFTRSSQPLAAISGMRGFVSQVEFANGQIWIPSRQDLASLLGILPPSPEEQRLTELYRTKGLPALIAELGKF